MHVHVEFGSGDWAKALHERMGRMRYGGWRRYEVRDKRIDEVKNERRVEDERRDEVGGR